MYNNIFSYMQDGSDHQSRAVLSHVQLCMEYFYAQRDNEEINISRWENGREQGYVIWATCKSEQINIAFFQHRNSDDIHCVVWNQKTMNAPNIETSKMGDIYKNKDDTTFRVKCYKYAEMGDYIYDRLISFFSNRRSK